MDRLKVFHDDDNPECLDTSTQLVEKTMNQPSLMLALISRPKSYKKKKKLELGFREENVEGLRSFDHLDRSSDQETPSPNDPTL